MIQIDHKFLLPGRVNSMFAETPSNRNRWICVSSSLRVSSSHEAGIGLLNMSMDKTPYDRSDSCGDLTAVHLTHPSLAEIEAALPTIEVELI